MAFLPRLLFGFFLLFNNLKLITGDTAQTLSRNQILFGTCYDAPEENQFNKSCLHLCQEEFECNDIIFSCYPYDFCFINCLDEYACHNLTILSPNNRIDTISLTCNEKNSCKNIRFQTFDVNLSFEQNLKLYMPKYIKFKNFYPNGNDIDFANDENSNNNDDNENNDENPRLTIRELISKAAKQSKNNNNNGNNNNNSDSCVACVRDASDIGNNNDNNCENACETSLNDNNNSNDNRNRFDAGIREEWLTQEYIDELDLKIIDFKLNLEPENDENTDEIKQHTKEYFDRNDFLEGNNKDYKMEFGKHYMLLRNILTPDFLETIQNLGKELNKTGDFQEHREFGDDEGTPYHGHTVIYLNNQLPQFAYNKFKKILLGIFDNWQRHIVDSSNNDNTDNIINNNNKQQNINYENDDSELSNENDLTGFIDIDFMKKYGLSHDWRHYRNNADTYNARVIEFIDYALDGSLGWHTDDDSQVTMVVLLNNDNLFDGGTLQFKQSTLDTDIESISLQYGDLVVFPSVADHRVLPIKNGSRQVIVLEWWDLPRNLFVGRHDPPAFYNLLKAKQLKQFTNTDNMYVVHDLITPFVFKQYNDPNVKKLLIEKDEHKHNDINEEQIMLDNELTFGDHFIHFHNVLNKEMIEEIQRMRDGCMLKHKDNDENDDTNVQRTEKRKFGMDGNIANIEDTEENDDKYANAGHTVTYMNDCFEDDNIYNYLKNIIIAGIDSLQYKCMINESCVTPNYVNDGFDAIWMNGQIKKFDNCYYIENENNIELMRHYGWKHDWYSIFESINNIDSRVIEYIIYNLNGNLGWHTDDDSKITMVALISDENDFEGGELEFRSLPTDEEIEEVTLKNGDIIIFPSMADHKINDIINGQRVVLVIEWWLKDRNFLEGRLSPEDFDAAMKRNKKRQQIKDMARNRQS